MKNLKHTVLLGTAALLGAAMLSAPASAVEITADPTTQFCFSKDDFTTFTGDEGVFITSVPKNSIATVYYGNRPLRAGDALPEDALNQLTLHTSCVTAQNTSVSYFTVANGKVTGASELKLSILPKKNDPPIVKDSSLETYKNIANSGMLSADDPDGDSLQFTITKEPKRGTVTIKEDGTFLYTPAENKVGKDSFTFTATDSAGNVSEPATVSILIKKPTDKDVYADMKQDPDACAAIWMREKGLFTGSEIGGHLCFSPDSPVTRGEFLVMTMKLVGADAENIQMASGFADESETPAWMQPFISAALSNGMISGVSSAEGTVFLPTAAMTRAEAAVMLQNILQLPNSDTTAVFAPSDEASVPAWATDAAAALLQAGITLEIQSAADNLTRRDAARLLYQVDQLIRSDAVPTFHWVR